MLSIKDFPLKLPHTLKITEKEIREGDARQCDTCPTALAWLRDLPFKVNGRTVGVDIATFQTEIILGAGTANVERWVLRHPKSLNEWICNLDRPVTSPSRTDPKPIEITFDESHFN